MRRKYQKPELRRVKLAPAEAVLSGCKITMNASSANKRCAESGCVNRLQGS